MIHLDYILIISAVMMFAGIFGFLTRRSTLAILLSIELMLNATDINFAVFNVADIFVVCGGIVLCVWLMFHWKDEAR